MESPTPGRSTKAAAASTGGGVKETIESILIAFILAFVFRAFVVEAFVIPTGSMAPTLLGAHMRFKCPDCGYEFDVNYNPIGGDDSVTIPEFAAPFVEEVPDGNGGMRKIIRPKVFDIRCPNCGYRIGDEEYSRFHVPPKVVTSPPIHYGDRILVLKYQYLWHEPRRWDVVVFKSPEDKPKYETNYIKRLVGRPGESIMILDGDVYVATDGGRNLSSFKVQTKPYSVQEALWRIIYDNDYHPLGLHRATGEPWRQPWTQQPGTADWDLGENQQTRRDFRFDNPSGKGTIYFDGDANPFVDSQGIAHPHAFTDWLAYDISMGQQKIGPNTFLMDVEGPEHTVSDLKLKFVYDRTSGTGPLQISLRKLDHTFTAELTPGGAKLFVRIGHGPEKQVGPTWHEDISGPWRIEFANVDYRVALRINDREVIATTPADYAPDKQMLLDAFKNDESLPPPGVRISAANQKCVLSHISLWRDVYYINRDPRILRATPKDFPSQVVHLKKSPGQDEYFCLGDNSLISEDGRYWEPSIDLPDENLYAPAGVVPERFMLGKAFFVYWPAGFRPTPGAPGIIPNFGEMRFIH